MKLLLDENLSRRIAPLLQVAYPDSSQVSLLNLAASTDRELWQYAKDNDFVIVTHDSDFNELSTLYGSPPKVIWLKTGNQSKVATLRILLDRQADILAALIEQQKSCIEIYA